MGKTAETKNYDEYTDEELIAIMRNGNSDIMEYLIDKYKALVRKKARVLYLAGGDQDDLIQEGMIGLFKAVRDYRADRSAQFSTFANLCVDRQLYHAVQSYNRQKHQLLNNSISLNSEEGESELRFLSQESPETIVVEQEYAAQLEEKIKSQLSSLEKQVMELYIGGHDYMEIASLLKRDAKSIDNALQRIRKKVKECMEF